MRKKILFIGILVLAGIIAFFVIRHSNKTEDGTLLLSGNVEVTESDIGFKRAGRVVELAIEEGQKVQKGQTVALLDSDELRSLMSESQAQLHESRAKLEELRTGSRPQEIEQAKADLSAADAELQKVKKDFERTELLFKNGAVSAQQMDAAEKERSTSLSKYQRALEKLSLVKEGRRKEEIRAGEERVRQSQAALRAARERLNDTVLYAPVSGVVLNKPIELGETVASGVPICTIGDLEKPWVKVYVKEDKLGRVRLGQKALVSTDTYPGKTYEGVVTYISSEAEFTPKNVQTQEERVKLVFGVKVSVKNLNDELKPGMPADVKIFLQ